MFGEFVSYLGTITDLTCKHFEQFVSFQVFASLRNMLHRSCHKHLGLPLSPKSRRSTLCLESLSVKWGQLQTRLVNLSSSLCQVFASWRNMLRPSCRKHLPLSPKSGQSTLCFNRLPFTDK